MKMSVILTALLIVAVCFKDSMAFVDILPPPTVAMPMESLIAPESMILGAGGAMIIPPAPTPAEASIFSSSLELANTMALEVNQFASTAFSTPEGESELLNDAAHVVMDFSGIFQPSKSTMRLFSIGGRLLGLLADYLPDHTIHVEEVAIQLFFICMTGQELLADDDAKDFIF